MAEMQAEPLTTPPQALPSTQGSDKANLTLANDPLFQKVFRRIAIYLFQPDPTGTLSLSYMTEGAANVVWQCRFSADSNLSRHDSSVVLRMRKDIPSTVPMVELKSQFEDRIAPLFVFDPSLLLPMDLVLLCPSLVQDLNAQLVESEAEGRRKALRRGIYHPSFETEPYAMLMPNLAHGGGTVLEFKPKWLVQSPSAPRGAQRCRTCALNVSRRAKGGSGRGDMGFCPFDLLSRNEEILSHALRQIWRDEVTLPLFAAAFKSKVQPALRQLQRLQRIHGTVGLQDFLNPVGKDFSVAMALRDCSVVLKVILPDRDHHEGGSSSGGGGEAEIPTIKLLDLDLKDTGGGKLAKWARMETELIEEGWYSTMTQPALDIKCAMAFQ